MNNSQKGILWIGVLAVVVLLFGDAGFRNKIFGRQVNLTSASGKSSVPYSLADILTLPANTSQAMLNAIGSVPASGKVQMALCH